MTFVMARRPEYHKREEVLSRDDLKEHQSGEIP